MAASGSAVNFDKVITKFIINKRTDAQKTDVNLLNISIIRSALVICRVSADSYWG